MIYKAKRHCFLVMINTAKGLPTHTPTQLLADSVLLWPPFAPNPTERGVRRWYLNSWYRLSHSTKLAQSTESTHQLEWGVGGER